MTHYLSHLTENQGQFARIRPNLETAVKQHFVADPVICEKA